MQRNRVFPWSRPWSRDGLSRLLSERRSYRGNGCQNSVFLRTFRFYVLRITFYVLFFFVLFAFTFYALRFTFCFSSCFSLLRPVFTGSSERDFTHHVLCFYHSTGGTVGQAKILGKAFVPSFYLNLSFPSQISPLTQPTSHNPSGPYHNPQHVRTAVNPVFYDSYSCKLFPPL